MPPREENEVIWILLALQYRISFFWVRNGCSSICKTAGRIVQALSRSLSREIPKLETPILRTSPFLTSSSMALQVSIMGTLSSIMQGLGDLSSWIHSGGYRTVGSTYLRLIGKWIRYRSRYSRPKSARDLRHAAYTC